MTDIVINDDKLKKVVGGAGGIYHSFSIGDKFICSWGKNYRVYTVNESIDCESENTLVSCYLETFNSAGELTCTPWNTTESAWRLLSYDKIN